MNRTASIRSARPCQSRSQPTNPATKPSSSRYLRRTSVPETAGWKTRGVDGVVHDRHLILGRSLLDEMPLQGLRHRDRARAVRAHPTLETAGESAKRNGAREGSWSGQGALTSSSSGTPKRRLASTPQNVLSA